jgi:hypothetical protein
MQQNQAVVQTLRRLGGIATLGQLYEEVFKIKECAWGTKTPFASIRRIVQTTPSIYKIKSGLYGLEESKERNNSLGYVVEDLENSDNKIASETNHTYYQGLLIEIGNLHGLKTYVRPQDQNKMFLQQPIGSKASVKKTPLFGYDRFVKRSSTIDVVWFNEREMPHSFFEVESTTDIQNSLLKFNDLQDFYTNMYIVAHDARKKEFEKKMGFSAFKDLTKQSRVKFMSYEEVGMRYNAALKTKGLQNII